MTKSVPSVFDTYARNGNSTKSNELGMRAMQERAYEKRGEQYLLIKSPPASGKSLPIIGKRQSDLNHRFFDRHTNLLGDRRPDIDAFGFCLDGDDQRVTGAELAAVAFGLVLPPAGNRIDADGTAFREIGGRADPDVRMKGSLVPGLANEPVCTVASAVRFPFFFLQCFLVEALVKLVGAFGRQLHVKTQAVRSVAVACPRQRSRLRQGSEGGAGRIENRRAKSSAVILG